MSENIVFKEGFALNTTPMYEGVTQDNCSVELTNNVFGEGKLSPNTGDITAQVANSGIASFTSVTHNASGTYETFYQNGVNYAVLNEWVSLYGENQVAVPMWSMKFGNANNYLILCVMPTHKWTSGGGTGMMDFQCNLIWSNSPWPMESGSTYSIINTYSSGTFTSNYPSVLYGYISYMRVHDMSWDIAALENPYANIALVISCTMYDATEQPTVHPKTRRWSTNGSGVLSMNATCMSLLHIATTQLKGWPTWSDFSEEVGEPSKEGGNKGGTFDNSSDAIAIPTSPTIGVSSVGFINVYRTSVNGLQGLGAELFPPLAYTPPTAIDPNASTTEALIQGFDAFVTFLANVPSFFDQFMAGTYINYIIDCHVIPVDPGAGTSESIKVGNKTVPISAGRIYTDYVDYPCGSISIGEYYTNFADYTGTSAKLYLPFVGFVPCRPEWFQNATLSVDYKFNVIDGSFACYVRAGGSHVGAGTSTIVGQYSGNACIHLPITGVTYSNMVSGLVGSAGGMVSGAGSGNIASVATSAINAASVHGDIAQSNSYNGSAAFLGCRYPFLLIERPVSSYAKNYQHEVGIPANLYGKLGDVTGFVRMDNVHLDGIPCTDEERAYIVDALKKGIIV